MFAEYCRSKIKFFKKSRTYSLNKFILIYIFCAFKKILVTKYDFFLDRHQQKMNEIKQKLKATDLVSTVLTTLFQTRLIVEEKPASQNNAIIYCKLAGGHLYCDSCVKTK